MSNKIIPFYKIFNPIIIGYAFLVGGIIQFLFGFSSTLISLMLILIILLSELIQFLKGRHIPFNAPHLVFGLILIIIVLSGIINGSSLLKIALYSLFFLFPVLIFSLSRRNIVRYNNIKVKKILLLISLIQLPVVFIQQNFYEYLMLLNSSSQVIDLIDFDFGTMLLKNDHALGYFLLCNILFVGTDKSLKLSRWLKVLIILELSFTVHYINSNSSFYLLIVTLLYLVFRYRYIFRLRYLLVISSSIIITLLVFWGILFKTDYYLEIRNNLEAKLNYNTALKYFNRSQANRSQIISILYNEEIRVVGDGPYSYFNIETGKFSDTYRHFSQLLWTYKDLGLFGLFLLLIYGLSFESFHLGEKEHFSILLLLFFLAYGFVTIVFFDVNFLLIYAIYSRSVSK